MKKSRYLNIGVVLLLLVIYLQNQGIRENINYICKLLLEMRIEELKNYILSFGVIGPVISILMLVLQCIISPLPASIIIFANAYIYGWQVGTLISCVGTLMGACLCFFISRIYGRPVAEKFMPSKILNRCDKIFDRYGKQVVYASRLLPFISFDGISYAAGLTQIRFQYFFWATAIGQIPRTLVLSILGKNISSPEFFNRGILFCSLATVIAMIICYIVYRKKYAGKSVTIILKGKYLKYKERLIKFKWDK